MANIFQFKRQRALRWIVRWFISLVCLGSACIVLFLGTYSWYYIKSEKVSPEMYKYSDLNVPIIFGVTPTYSRLTQKADITRLCHTLEHIPRFHWVLVEDAVKKTNLMTSVLQTCNVNYTHLYVQSPQVQLSNHGLSGNIQRNMALKWIRKHVNLESGVVYFMDDDNTYDLRIFEEIRNTQKVSVWPVGFAGGMLYEGPIAKNGKVFDWRVGWAKSRRFPLDMAGFAVSLDILSTRSNVEFRYHMRDFASESDFLIDLNITTEDLEPVANDCSQVLVWHTKTSEPSLKLEQKWEKHHPHEKLLET